LKIDADYAETRDKFKRRPEVFEPGYEDKTKRVIRNLENEEGISEKRRILSYGTTVFSYQNT
jgi:hypothetical protein